MTVVRPVRKERARKVGKEGVRQRGSHWFFWFFILDGLLFRVLFGGGGLREWR